MKIIRVVLPALALALGACQTPRPQSWRLQGVIAPDGATAGYQHGPQGSQFAIGDHPKYTEEYRYLKMLGTQGTFAANRMNGSSLAVPSTNAPSLRLPFYGRSSDDHDMFVKNYFVKLGLPPEQVGSVRGMTLLDSQGRVAEAGRTIPHIQAYYSRLERVVDGVPVADSFAWARANSHGEIVHEGVYWPSLPVEVLTQARQFRQLMADPQRRRSFESRLPISGQTGAVVIHHSSATIDQPFESFASFDVAVRVSPVSPGASQKAATVVTRHFDINGKEIFLPQELLDLGTKYRATKREGKK